MSVLFSWQESEMQALLGSCERDGAWPLIARYFPAGSRLLEAGCGAGRWVRFLEDRGYDVTGLEYNGETVEMVRKTWPDLDVVQGDCEASPFPEGSFDGVLSFGVVEHWPEGPQKPLRDLWRVLKPGGLALVTVPCFNAVRRVKRALWWDEITRAPRALAGRLLKGKPKPLSRLDRRHLFPVFPAWGEFFEYRMSPAAFRAEVEKAGFEVVAHEPLGGMDGIYHELNPFGLLVGFRNWTFSPGRVARFLDARLSRRPFLHAHLQAIVARKPVAP